jgi:hypothetical protein
MTRAICDVPTPFNVSDQTKKKYRVPYFHIVGNMGIFHFFSFDYPSAVFTTIFISCFFKANILLRLDYLSGGVDNKNISYVNWNCKKYIIISHFSF